MLDRNLFHFNSRKSHWLLCYLHFLRYSEYLLSRSVNLIEIGVQNLWYFYFQSCINVDWLLVGEEWTWYKSHSWFHSTFKILSLLLHFRSTLLHFEGSLNQQVLCSILLIMPIFLFSIELSILSGWTMLTIVLIYPAVIVWSCQSEIVHTLTRLLLDWLQGHLKLLIRTFCVDLCFEALYSLDHPMRASYGKYLIVYHQLATPTTCLY